MCQSPPPSELSRCVPHLSPTPIRCKGSLSLPVCSHCCAGTDLPYWRRRYGAICTLKRDSLCAVCPSRSLPHTSPLGASSVLKCFSYRLLLLHLAAAFNISLELQGDCSDQLTLICRHSDVLTDPNWIHNGTAEGGQLLSTAFPGAMYTVRSNTKHRVTISGVGNVQALDGYIIQCVYSILGDVTKSNAVKYSFIPPGQCMCCKQNTFMMYIFT